jgi:hypothetical protein
MTFPSAQQTLEREKVHPGLGACQSEKQELELAQVALGLVSLAHRKRTDRLFFLSSF